jgi:uncharacterized protein
MDKKVKRLMYLGFGWLMFSIGFVGAFLPVLPTTPFMLLALWGFSKGSDNLHNWLYHHPKYGALLSDWEKYRIIPIKAKITAISMMCLSAGIMIFFSDVPKIALYCALGIMVIGAVFILTKPSKKPE